METINGEWYMKGCRPDDPGRLRSAQDAARLIRQIGFLPLFSNDLPGFSIEEHTCAGDWWTGDPDTDPWEWRIALSSEAELLYGKFYARRAGFVSAQWFPCFANFRRDGYDFDTLCDEGMAPYRAQKLMQPFLTDGMPNETALLSCTLKEQAGFGKGGEKNFEGIVTELQMQSYLVIGAFRQKQNKRGLPYGWHLGELTTPEAKLGYAAIAAGYREPPTRSMQRMAAQLRQYYPQATDTQLRKLLGLRQTAKGEAKDA